MNKLMVFFAMVLLVNAMAETPTQELSAPNGARPESLWVHLKSASELVDAHGINAAFDDSGDCRVLKLDKPRVEASVGPAKWGIAWVAVPPPEGGWRLEKAKTVEADIKNMGDTPVDVTLWVVCSNGWEAVGRAVKKLEPGQTATLCCDLRETYPDGTAQIDPRRVRQIRIMVVRKGTASVAVSKLVSNGTADDWVRPSGRLDVPNMLDEKPAAGRRVRYQLPADKGNEIYCVLYLPPEWRPGKRFPVIAEYPGNSFFAARICWSTGRPEQCAMGYGISSGTNAIWVSLPFVDRPNGQIAISGFGSNAGDDTARYAVDVIEDICANWGGDRENLFLSGFSRGAIACGYIGLRNDEIAKLWKGFVACQHYDGSAWHESRMKDAIRRAPRFRGKAIFQADNGGESGKYGQLMDYYDPSVQWTWATSGLRHHGTAMFLDNRPMAKQVRTWFRDLTKKAGSDPVDTTMLPEGVKALCRRIPASS